MKFMCTPRMESYLCHGQSQTFPMPRWPRFPYSEILPPICTRTHPPWRTKEQRDAKSQMHPRRDSPSLWHARIVPYYCTQCRCTRVRIQVNGAKLRNHHVIDSKSDIGLPAALEKARYIGSHPILFGLLITILAISSATGKTSTRKSNAS